MNTNNELIEQIVRKCFNDEANVEWSPVHKQQFAQSIIDIVTEHNCKTACEAVENMGTHYEYGEIYKEEVFEAIQSAFGVE